MAYRRLARTPRALICLAAIAGALGVAILADGQSAHAKARNQNTLGLPAAWRRAAGWYRIGGRKIYGVRLTMRVDHHGRLVARVAAQYGNASQVANHGTKLCISSYPDVARSQIHQYPCNGSNNQQWLYGRGSEGLFNIYSFGTPGSYCLDNDHGSLTDNNPQILYGCFTEPSAPLGYAIGGSATSGDILIHLMQGLGSESKFCMSSLGQPSSPAVAYTCNINSPNQAWNLYPGGW